MGLSLHLFATRLRTLRRQSAQRCQAVSVPGQSMGKSTATLDGLFHQQLCATEISFMRQQFAKHLGFTLIELLVVVLILGILAAMVVPKVMSRPDEARVIAAKQDIGAIMQALKLYRLDTGRYPSSDQGLAALVTKPTTGIIPNNWKSGGYLEKLPKDPWGTTYQFLNPGIKGEIDVFSYGADRQPGGDGIDSDIGSWDL